MTARRYCTFRAYLGRTPPGPAAAAWKMFKTLRATLTLARPGAMTGVGIPSTGTRRMR